MRKRIVGPSSIHESPNFLAKWLDLEQIATVEVTSEDPNFPIDSVFNGNGPGWRAQGKGQQQIRIIFDQPVSIRRIHLRFAEPDRERTQEFTLKCSMAQGGPLKEIVRQQWNFSPAASTSEVEDYQVDLQEVVTLELDIRPDVAGGDAVATLAEWRVA